LTSNADETLAVLQGGKPSGIGERIMSVDRLGRFRRATMSW
jgi:hypothetical protein